VSVADGCACCDPAGYAESTDWPADVSRLLYERLAELGFAGRSVLEIGFGYGRLLVGALLGGARQATGVELDDEALDAARERAEEAGVDDRCVLVAGDGAELDLGAHDLVVLDRVICCYADGDGLVERSMAEADRAFAITVPETRGLRGTWNRVTYAVGGLLDRLRGEEPVYLHDVRRMERRLTAGGFRVERGEHFGKWYVAVYLRDAG
jgi:SAM-dependent methyltransferase